MKVLCSCLPAHGHLHPILPVAAALRAASHEVTFATESGYGAQIRELGYATFAVGEDMRTPAVRMVTAHPEFFTFTPLQQRAFTMRHLFAGIRLDESVDVLLETAEMLRPDVLLHDPAEFAAPLVAAILDVPNICVGYGLMLQPQLRLAGEEGAAAQWRRHGFLPAPDGGLYRHLYLDPTPPALADPAVPGARTAQPVRPIPFGDPAAQLPAILDRFDDRPLVYVTLGTLYNGDLSPLKPIISGLLRMPVNVIVTVGSDADPAAVDPRMPGVVVERFIPQAALIPRCALVVTHGGASSVSAPLGLGIPLLLTPRGADQFENTDAVVRAGAGIAIQPQQLHSDSVTEAVQLLLNDSSYRTAANHLRDEYAAMPHPDQLVKMIEKLAGGA